MNRLAELLISLFHWVCSVSVMAAVLAVLIIVMQRMLRHRLKPRWHYLLWILLMFKLMLPWGPESELSIYNWIGFTEPAHPAHSAVSFQAEPLADDVPLPDTTLGFIYRHLFVIWLAGVCILGSYTIWVNGKFARTMRQETTAITDASVIQLFDQCKKRMAIHRHIVLAESSSLTTPTLFGWLKPRLILPTKVVSLLDDNQLQHVFLHELAHCRRNDIAVNWMMHILLIVHWFNPVLWYAYRRMREDQEIASDALALSCLSPGQSRAYGLTLITLLENLSSPIPTAGSVNLTGNKSQLQRRIHMIKQFKTNSYRWSFLGMAAIIFISGCTLTSPKSDQTATQYASEKTSEGKTEESASAAKEQTALTGDSAKQTASADGQPSNPGGSDSASVSAGTQQTASSDAPKPAAPTETQSVASSESPQPVPAQAAPQAAPDNVKKPQLVPQDSSVKKPAPVPQQQNSDNVKVSAQLHADGSPQPAPPASAPAPVPALTPAPVPANDSSKPAQSSIKLQVSEGTSITESSTLRVQHVPSDNSQYAAPAVKVLPASSEHAASQEPSTLIVRKQGDGYEVTPVLVPSAEQ
ncbi:M56 family metallopeptidase [Paenibacillus thalictri]|uniref:Peptidase M56 domain-containing protein n=1 Tax=Paenibacillus thalictri TaxID=2527873 RepID=A0A4Q9DUJ1_9BACL|nr:M56 family metallopeptidase [Paenibacillus thalictri]TBL80629.1 hypothetical protein EYB31_05210 [Paenibacillus thalictri]